MSKTCKNCEFEFDESFKFCPKCGQNYHEDLTLGVIFKNTINNYFSVDARLFRSIVPLLFKPGFLPSAYVKGKRAFYLNPAQFYLFASVVFFFLYSFIFKENEKQIDKLLDESHVVVEQPRTKNDSLILDITNKTLSEINKDKPEEDKVVGGHINLNKRTLDSLISVNATDADVLKVVQVDPDSNRFQKKFLLQAYKLYKNRSSASLLSTFYNYIPIALFILLPIFALLLKLLYYRKGKYAYHLVFSLYYFTFLFVVLSVVNSLSFMFELPKYTSSFIVLISLIYLTVGLRKFYKSSIRSSVFKALFLSGLFSIIILFTFIQLAFIAFLYY